MKLPVKIFLIAIPFYFTGCYTQLATRDYEQYDYQNSDDSDQYSDSEYYYEESDSLVDRDGEYYYDEEADDSDLYIENNSELASSYPYYDDYFYYPRYRRYFWGYYPTAYYTTGVGFYGYYGSVWNPWYWDDFYPGYCLVPPYYNYYPSHLWYSNYFYPNSYYHYGGYGSNSIYKYRTHDSRLRDNDGGRGRVASIRDSYNSRGSAGRTIEPGRTRDIDRELDRLTVGRTGSSTSGSISKDGKKVRDRNAADGRSGTGREITRNGVSRSGSTSQNKNSVKLRSRNTDSKIKSSTRTSSRGYQPKSRSTSNGSSTKGNTSARSSSRSSSGSRSYSKPSTSNRSSGSKSYSRPSTSSGSRSMSGSSRSSSSGGRSSSSGSRSSGSSRSGKSRR